MFIVSQDHDVDFIYIDTFFELFDLGWFGNYKLRFELTNFLTLLIIIKFNENYHVQ